MSTASEIASGFDVFLSHGSPDKPWVRTLRDELVKLGLKAFLDESELETGENWTLRLSKELLQSRALELVISAETLKRPWVEHEWTSFLAEHGPTSGRLIPVLLDAVVLPTFLKPIQVIKAKHRDAALVAQELAAAIGRYENLPDGDARRLFIGQDLVFVLDRLDDRRLAVTDPTGRRREVPAPWSLDGRYSTSRILFDRLTREPVRSDADRAELHRHAATLGGLLFDLLFDETGIALLRDATITGQARPLVTVRSDDVMLLALPWELIHHDGRYLVRDGVVNLVRTDARDVGSLAVLRPPAERFGLVVNVSAPEGSGLDYERESYRITLALTQHCTLTATELGTLGDLVETVRRAGPTGIHFSGHGGPGELQFEDDEGRNHAVKVGELVDRLRRGLPDGSLPPFFYLANCHGNDPAAIGEGGAGVESLAARLHREGVAQVVAYSGPILDVLSTEAEAALYAAIADGQTTRFAVHQAREALGRPIGPGRSVLREVDPRVVESMRESFPFAWSQLVLYHRGPDHPLSRPVPVGPPRRGDEAPHRTFLDAGARRILVTGFIGRRRELHRLRRKVREGQRVFVLQGLGGLGKSTLALHTLREILHAQDELCILWCQDAEKAGTPEGIAEALVGQLLEYCRRRFGVQWESIVQQVDRAAGADPARRFGLFLQVLVGKTDRLVVYLDNLESLLVGPGEIGPADPDAFGQWRTPALQAIWAILRDFAEDSAKVDVVASCRYRNDEFGKALIPVGPLPAGALFRLMGWFPGLRRLSVESRARLSAKLDGHPRAVEFANDLLEHAMDAWEEKTGREWILPAERTADDLAREWTEIVEPALPKVADKLGDDLLFREIWDHVLDDRARRMLYRMTLLRRPWVLAMERELGEAGEPAETAEATARRLRRTSLLEQVELLTTRDGLVRHDTIHPATAQFVARRSGADPALQRETHGRVGAFYEARARTSIYLQDRIEAGHHLLQAGEYNRACDLLGSASVWLQNHGRVREALQLLEPFLTETVQREMTPKQVGPLLGTVGTAYARLGQVQRAIDCFEQALVIDRDIGDRRGEGDDVGNLGLAYARLGQLERAIDSYQKQLAIAREIGDRRGEGNALGNMGLAYDRLGQVELAVDFEEQALVIHREVGDRLGEGADLGNLGLAYAQLGQVERAIDYYEKQLAIVREIGDQQGEGNALANLGSAYARLGEVERAIKSYERALSISREIGDRRGEGLALAGLGLAYADLGQVERAIGLLEQAQQIGEEIKDAHTIQIVTVHLPRLRGNVSARNPENG